MFKNFGKNGTTLIEILVAISIFSVVATSVTNLFASLINYQNEILNKAYLLNTISFANEYMAKALRMAQKDTTGSCITAGYNFITTGGSNVKFLNYNNECQEFFLESGTLKVRKLGVSQALTPGNVNIENLKFILSGESQNDNLQPKVSFTLKVKMVSNPQQNLSTQTTVSQRMLDIYY
ncbi:MAG: type II secretion system protein [Candidatus Pacebacteria bacterium]|nr:type II secretion system protein [Candidatus Paceibacterota bacterium]